MALALALLRAGASLWLLGGASSSGLDDSWDSGLQDVAPSDEPFLSRLVANSAQCRVLCQRSAPCRAVLFLPLERRCQLYQESASRLQHVSQAWYFGRSLMQTEDSSSVPWPCLDGYTSTTVNSPSETTVCLPMIHCPSGLPATENGYVAQLTGSDVGFMAIYSCDGGHVFEGSSNTVTCSLNGTWIGLQGRCVANCGPPPVFADTERFYTSTTVGAIVSYRCSGHLILELLCLDNGEWGNRADGTARYVYNATAGVAIMVVQSSMNWELSRDECQGHCGELAILDSSLKIDFAATLVPSTDYCIYNNCFRVGVNCTTQKGVWLWLNGEHLDPKQSPWCPNQPDDWRGKESCAVLCKVDGNPGLNDVTCSLRMPALCTMTALSQSSVR